MATIFIIHGAFGNPEENWFPWLKRELEQYGHTVYIPAFPTPENQSIQSWLEVFQQYEQYIDEQTIFIGHSLGPAFILDILKRTPQPIHAAYFVAGFVSPLNNPTFDTLNASFVTKSFDWETIKRHCKKFSVFYSDSDPYVSPVHADELAQLLSITPINIPNAGHFNIQTGYTTFPQLLKKIKEELK
mgnify:FL=1